MSKDTKEAKDTVVTDVTHRDIVMVKLSSNKDKFKKSEDQFKTRLK